MSPWSKSDRIAGVIDPLIAPKSCGFRFPFSGSRAYDADRNRSPANAERLDAKITSHQIVGNLGSDGGAALIGKFKSSIESHDLVSQILIRRISTGNQPV